MHGPLWNEAHSNKYSAPGAYRGNIMPTFKGEYPRFYLHSCCLMAAVMLLYFLEPNSYTRLYPWFKIPWWRFPICWRVEFKILGPILENWIRQALFVLNRWPLNIQSSLSGSPYPALILKCSNPHSDNMSRSCYSILPSSPVYIPRSFCFSLFCTQTYVRPGSHTFFISLSHLYFWALWWNQHFLPANY